MSSSSESVKNIHTADGMFGSLHTAWLYPGQSVEMLYLIKSMTALLLHIVSSIHQLMISLLADIG